MKRRAIPQRGGGSGRGGIRGRGRGRGRGGRSNGGQYSRLKEVESEAEEGFAPEDSEDLSEVASASLRPSDIEGSSSGDDNEAEVIKSGPGSYATLLQSFGTSTNTTSRGKKRKRKQQLTLEEVSGNNGVGYSPESGVEEEGETELDTNDLPNNQLQQEIEDSVIDKEDEDPSDPFEVHFDKPEENILSEKLKAINATSWKTDLLPANTTEKLFFTSPDTKPMENAYQHHKIDSVMNIKLKKRLLDPALHACPQFNDVQRTLAPALFNYSDMLYGGRTVKNADGLRKMACLHALNHVFKTRDRIIKNTARLARDQTEASLDLRDQGFTRPKILIILETRQSCVRYMNTITELCDPDQVENKKRFQDAFVQEEAKFSDDKPEDFRELFEGNDDNEWRLGLKFTRKTMKYYSQFYSSDIILASPLGLRRATKSDDPKKADSDFLSSIEMVIIDQADAMLMQNWEHVEFAFSHLNLQPKESHGCDFSRVRQWYLHQNAKYLRQTIVFSAYLTPELNSLFSTHMQNVAGKLKVVPIYTGSMLEQSPQLPIRQIFTRFPSPNPATDPDTRFKYFSTAVLPSITRHRSGSSKLANSAVGTLLFIPSYLDFVRIRNYFSNAPETSHISFGTISEYTDLPEVRRARSHFLSGRHDILLYTGRAHHFRRYLIKGVKRVIMYSLPENPVFYSELVGGFLGESAARQDGTDVSVRVIFSKWDALALERIVGSARVGKMVREGAGDTYEFK